MIFLKLCIPFLFLFASVALECPENNVQMLVTFHPHLDAFWLNTDVELTSKDFRPVGFLYEMNQRNSKQIYDSMYEALTEANHTNRRYFTTQVFFLKDWYQYIDENKKMMLKQLLAEGRLEITNSGWVQNDQATCYYDDIIEQYTVGMNYLYQNFRYVNQIGWATDSFGHSHSQVALLNQLGIIMQGIQRVDQRYIHLRNNQSLLQFFWQARSDSNNLTYGGILTHIRYFLHEVNNLRQFHATPDLMKNEFKAVTAAMQKLYHKNLMFRFLGNDFQQFIPAEFTFLQNLMNNLNIEPKCNAYHYGNPSQYLVKIKQYWKSRSLQTRQYDFMPNWDHDRYWTGYYTTYPSLKKKCKDSSRLLNWFRRDLINLYSLNVISNLSEYINILTPIQEQIAIMQHHDGITATSKHHIEEQMIQRLIKGDRTLIQTFKKNHKFEINLANCQMITNNNLCHVKLPQRPEMFTLIIFNSGTTRTDRIEVLLDKDFWYKLEDNDEIKSQMFCLQQNYSGCRIILQGLFINGKNQLTFHLTTIQQLRQSIVTIPMTSYISQFYKSAVFRLENSDFIYEYQQHKYIIGYYVSTSRREARQTMEWDKYNNQLNKTQFPSSGLYIMFNDGNITSYAKPNKMIVLKGSNFLKIILKYDKPITMTITTSSGDLGILDIQTQFSLQRGKQQDYFLKVETDVISAQNEFYHDSNGYLVIKRKIDQRPDYNIKLNQHDKINSNTYPATSFAYVTNAQYKFLMFIDRAQGVTLYENKALLLNLDRITDEDGKGAGEGYQFYYNNTFRQKLTIVNKVSDIQRKFQKIYDEPLQGFYSPTTITQFSNVQSFVIPDSQYQKYTVALLNNHSAVIRIQNLHQFIPMQLNLFRDAGTLSLQAFNLKLKYVDMVQSFHNGIPLKEKYQWRKLVPPGDVNIHKNKIQNGLVILQPLQIRSFRLDFTNPINKDYKTHTEIVAEYLRTHPNQDPIQFYNKNPTATQNLQRVELPKSQGQFPEYNINPNELPKSQGQFPEYNNGRINVPISQSGLARQNSNSIFSNSNGPTSVQNLKPLRIGRRKRCF